jgi:hypothetical protein
VPTNFAKCIYRKIKTVGTARKRGAFAHPCISAKKLSLKPKSGGQSESVLTIFAFGHELVGTAREVRLCPSHDFCSKTDQGFSVRAVAATGHHVARLSPCRSCSAHSQRVARTRAR